MSWTPQKAALKQAPLQNSCKWSGRSGSKIVNNTDPISVGAIGVPYIQEQIGMLETFPGCQWGGTDD